jgi:RHS repeat-associated protein
LRNLSPVNYRFGFNGKEKDSEPYGEGNEYDYGFRMYDPRIARFQSVDPLKDKYPFYTPYQFAGNTPIQAIDLDGLEPVTVTNNTPGNESIELVEVSVTAPSSGAKGSDGAGLNMSSVLSSVNKGTRDASNAYKQQAGSWFMGVPDKIKRAGAAKGFDDYWRANWNRLPSNIPAHPSAKGNLESFNLVLI